MTTPPDTPKPPMFANVSCSQCGRDFGPGYHGYSHCRDHTESPQESHKLAEGLDAAVAFWREKLKDSWAPEYRRHTETLIAAALRSSPSEQEARDAARYRAFCAWWIGDDTGRHDSFIENIMYVDTKEQMDAHIDRAVAASGGAKGDGNG